MCNTYFISLVVSLVHFEIHQEDFGEYSLIYLSLNATLTIDIQFLISIAGVRLLSALSLHGGLDTHCYTWAPTVTATGLLKSCQAKFLCSISGTGLADFESRVEVTRKYCPVSPKWWVWWVPKFHEN